MQRYVSTLAPKVRAKVYSTMRRRKCGGAASAQVSRNLKTKVALEALRGERTLQEIAAQYQVHLTRRSPAPATKARSSA